MRKHVLYLLLCCFWCLFFFPTGPGSIWHFPCAWTMFKALILVKSILGYSIGFWKPVFYLHLKDICAWSRVPVMDMLFFQHAPSFAGLQIFQWVCCKYCLCLPLFNVFLSFWQLLKFFFVPGFQKFSLMYFDVGCCCLCCFGSTELLGLRFIALVRFGDTSAIAQKNLCPSSSPLTAGTLVTFFLVGF